MISVNAEEKDCLLPRDERADQQKAIRVRRLRIAQLVLAAAVVVMWIVLVATGAILKRSRRDEPYDPEKTCIDILIAQALFEVLVVAVTMLGSSKAFEVGQYGAVLVLVLVAAKLWIFSGWSRYKGDAAVIAVALVSAVVQFVLCRIATNLLSETPEVKLQWSSCKKILVPYIWPRGVWNKFMLAMTWVVLITGKVCGILSPIVLGNIVTNLTQTPPAPCGALIALYCALNLVPTILREVQDNLYVKVWQTAYAEVAETTFRHLHNLSLEWHLKKKMGNVVRALDRGMIGADTLMYYAMIYLFPAVASAVAAFVVFAVHFNQPQIAAVCFLAFGFYCWVTFAVTMWRRKFREQMNKHDNEMHDKASDSLINFETVKCFTNEEHEVQQYIDSVIAYQTGSFKTQASVSVLNISQGTTIQLAMLGSLLIASYCTIHQEDGFNPGEFVAIQAYVMTIFSPLSFLGTVYTMIINSVVDIQNLSDLLAVQADIVDSDHAVDLGAELERARASRVGSGVNDGVTIEFRDVYFRYPSAGPEQGLKGISFVIEPGTTTAIVGPTGSGKTTISRLLFRFYDPNEGAVLINGHDIRQCTQRSVRRMIGVVPQDTVMFNESVRYNIRYGRLTATDGEVEEAAKKAQVHDFVLKFEKGYDTVCGERGLKMSGGEKQRVAIARCLLKNPPVVLLDEATSALDNKTEREIQAVLQCLEGRTTLVIAHRLSTISRANQIIVLKDGRIAERGTHTQLLAANGLYASMWNMQLYDQATDYTI